MVRKTRSGKAVAKTPAKRKPQAKPKAPAKRKPAAKTAVKRKPVAKAKPAARRKPAAKPATRRKPAAKPRAAAKRKPAAKPRAAAKIATKRKTTAAKSKTVTKRKPAAKRAMKRKTVDKVKTATRRKPAAKRKPAAELRVAAKAKPATKRKPTAKPKTAAKPKPAMRRKPAAKPTTGTKQKTTAKRPSPAKTVAKRKLAVKPKVVAKPKAAAPKKAAASKKATKPRASARPKPKPAVKAAPKPAAVKPVPRTDRDWSETLFLPKTDFPMKAGLPKREPELLERWTEMRLYDRLRQEAKGRSKFVLHDGPPYANGHLHIGHALNKILKDVITRSQAMMGKDANYVPGWDCHGLPIEWKVEEEQYRAKGKTKPDLKDPEALIAFRRECRDEATKWLDVQREEFKRLGIEGDWDHPYATMSFDAEATIARELMKFAMNGLLYRGSKPVMWSVVERTALAEAEVEYQEIESPTIYVKFPVLFSNLESQTPQTLQHASVVIWTTTPWTIPGNRAISYSPSISYGLYEITEAPDDNWAKLGERLVIADALAETVKAAARIDGWSRLGDVTDEMLRHSMTAHPLRSEADYRFKVPLLPGDHVTEETGTGFVHTAPGHGADDFEVWTANEQLLRERDIDPEIPFTVDEAGFFTKDAPRFEGKRVVDDKGKFGDANNAVIAALTEANALIARSRYKHDYPHSWRSKKPVIFRATPQWFIAMDRTFDGGDTLRVRGLKAIDETRFVPPQGEKRIKGMVDTRHDWVV